MAHVIKPYLMEEASILQNGSIVLEAVEWYQVRLDASDYAQGATCGLFAAMNATGLPILFSDHPQIPGLCVLQYIPKPYGKNDVLVGVRYVNMNPQVTMRGGCALQATETNMAFNSSGALVPIKCSNYNASKGITSESTGLVVQPVTVTTLDPVPVFVATRVVADEAYGGINPVQFQDTYVGTINGQDVTIRGKTFAAGELICENFGFDNDGLGGVAWRIEVEIRANKRGHCPEAAMIDTETGMPADNLTLDANYSKTSSPLARCASNPSDTQSGRKIVRTQRTAYWPTLIALFA